MPATWRRSIAESTLVQLGLALARRDWVGQRTCWLSVGVAEASRKGYIVVLRTLVPWLTLLCVYACGVAAGQTLAYEGRDEVLYLDDVADPGRWDPSECTVERSSSLQARGRPTLRMHIPVDHHGGEEKYPIGWPRMYCELRKPAETQWLMFDRFEFEVFAEMSRPAPPTRALTFQVHCPGKPQVFLHNFDRIKLDEWTRVVIPTSGIANVGEVAKLGLNISESEYQDKDVLDFTIGGFRLVRSAECELTSMAIQSPVVFRGRPALPVELVVVGPSEHVSRGIPFTLRRGDRVLRVETLPVRRGRQALAVDVSELALDPGEYSLVAFAGDEARQRTGTFRVVETPWKAMP